MGHVKEGAMDLLLVSVPPRTRKKPYDDALTFAKSLNFGLLALATHARGQGYSVQIVDPQALPEEAALRSVLEAIAAARPAVVGLSCISGFSYPTLKCYA